jgi:hypothetical protein
MKTNFTIYLPIIAVLVIIVCVCIFTACKDKEEPQEKGGESSDDIFQWDRPLDEDFTTPSGFDSKKTGDTYGILTERSYSSATTGATRKCYVYTPPGYDPNVTYPIMYLLHGIGGTHTEWLEGKPNEILSNLINAGKAKPMIVVMPNVRAKKDDSASGEIYGQENINAFNNFINDLNTRALLYLQRQWIRFNCFLYFGINTD